MYYDVLIKDDEINQDLLAVGNNLLDNDIDFGVESDNKLECTTNPLSAHRNARRSHRRCSVKNGVLRNFAIFTGKHLCWRLFLIKLQKRKVIKKKLQHRCFPVNIAKFLTTPILKNICERLLLACSQWILSY